MKKAYKLLPLIMIIAVGCCYFITGMNMPGLGDDLGFYHSYKSQADIWYALPRFWWRHWQFNNGRLADMLLPVWLNIFPIWLNALWQGLITSLFFLLPLLIARAKGKISTAIKVTLLFLMAFTLRWDALWMEFAANYNYILSAVAGMVFIWLFYQRQSKLLISKIILPILGFIAAAMHEASGLPLAAGMFVSILVSKDIRQNLTLFQKISIMAVIAGSLLPLSSPGAWKRVGTLLQPDSLWQMVVLSGAYSLAAVILSIIVIITKPTLRKALIDSAWMPLIVASTVSFIFMLLTHMGGRAGWFAQIYGITSLLILYTTYINRFKSDRKANSNRDKTTKIIYSLVVASAFFWHYSEIAYWQCKLAKECREAISLYSEAEDGVVFMDYTSDKEMPLFLLNKVHGIPDHDDTYYLHRLQLHYGKNEQRPVFLPDEARKALGKDSLNWTNGEIFICTTPWSCDKYRDCLVSILPRTMCKKNNIEYIERKFRYSNRDYWLYAPVDRDAGEK